MAADGTLVVARERCEVRFPAMGSGAHVVVHGGGAEPVAVARARLEELERRWSRFLPTSEVSLLNRSAGRPTVVSADTVQLLLRSIEARHRTGGRFQPTTAAALAALGYDRDFRVVAGRQAPAPAPVPQPLPDLGAVEVDEVSGLVTVPAGTTIDPGGIGKGLAADLCVAAALEAGAAGALVGIGGDVSAGGAPPAGHGWPVSVPHPLPPARELLRLELPWGGIATSSRLLRRWHTTAGEVHHLLDPATGAPVVGDVVAVTAVAATAWWAEAATKAVFVGGLDAATDLGVEVVVVRSDGSCTATPGLEGTLR